MVYMSTRGALAQWGWSERLCEVSLALPERYKRVVEGHLQLQRWHKGLCEVI